MYNYFYISISILCIISVGFPGSTVTLLFHYYHVTGERTVTDRVRYTKRPVTDGLKYIKIPYVFAENLIFFRSVTYRFHYFLHTKDLDSLYALALQQKHTSLLLFIFYLHSRTNWEGSRAFRCT